MDENLAPNNNSVQHAPMTFSLIWKTMPNNVTCRTRWCSLNTDSTFYYCFSSHCIVWRWRLQGRHQSDGQISYPLPLKISNSMTLMDNDSWLPINIVDLWHPDITMTLKHPLDSLSSNPKPQLTSDQFSILLNETTLYHKEGALPGQPKPFWLLHCRTQKQPSKRRF